MSVVESTRRDQLNQPRTRKAGIEIVNVKCHKPQFARLLKRGIILAWLLHTQVDVPPCSKDLEGGFLASPIE